MGGRQRVSRIQVHSMGHRGGCDNIALHLIGRHFHGHYIKETPIVLNVDQISLPSAAGRHRS